MSSFPCTGCGACCLVAGSIKPELARAEGPVCKHLNDDRTCNIYEDRPDYCRIDFKLNGKKFNSEREYFEASVKGCMYVIDQFGLEDSWIPTLPLD